MKQPPLISTIICWIIVIIIFYIFYRILKSKIRKTFGGGNINTHSNSNQEYSNSNYRKSEIEREPEPSIDGTVEVDKAIIHNLKYNMTFNRELEGMTTSTGYDARHVFDEISYFIRKSSNVAKDLKYNESKLNPGTASSSAGRDNTTMSHYEVTTTLLGWSIKISLRELESLSSVTQLKGEIDNGLILGNEAFYGTPTKF